MTPKRPALGRLGSEASIPPYHLKSSPYFDISTSFGCLYLGCFRAGPSFDVFLMKRADLPRQFYEAADSYGWRASLLHVGALFLLLACAVPLWRNVGPWAAWLLVLPVAVVAYKLTIVLHDCAHYTLFKNRRLNRFVGQCIAALLGSDFEQFARTHWLHHRAYGSPNDPQGHDYIGLHNATRAALCWHLLRPLLGYNFFKVIVFNPAAPAQSGAAPRTSLIVFAMRVLCAQAAIALVATGLGEVPWLIFLFPAASATFALFLSQVRGFCEHVARRESSSEAFVRTHLPNALDRTLFYGLNFNFHVEHHLYPSVPSCHLPAVYEEIRARVHTKETLSPSILHTIRDRLAQCAR